MLKWNAWIGGITCQFFFRYILQTHDYSGIVKSSLEKLLKFFSLHKYGKDEGSIVLFNNKFLNFLNVFWLFPTSPTFDFEL